MDYYAPYKKALSQSQMQVNAVWLRNYLQNQGWSLNAICAALGNWESECTLNPNRPQYSNFPATNNGGFGLPQWTPWGKKYGAWCKAQNIPVVANDSNPAGRFEPQIAYHDYECVHGYAGGKTWFSKKGYSYKWEQWKRSNDDVRTLAIAYYWQYERSGRMNPGSRPDNAVKWYQYLSGQPYNPISGGSFLQSPAMRTPFSFGTMKLLYLWLLIQSILKGR